MGKRFVGQVAVVTGGGSGIGRATAIAFAREGARVVIADVHERAGATVVDEITADGGTAIFIRGDVSRDTDVRALFEEAAERFGALDFAVNNAGIEGTRASIVDMTEADFRRTLDINVTGVWLCMKYELDVMRRQSRGAIVNVSSIFGNVGAMNAAAYVASKHAVIGLTRAAALEGAAHGIRVNAVCPGYIKTPMLMERGIRASGDPHRLAELEARAPIGRLGEPEEVAEAIMWLCSDASSFVTGHPLIIDGGYVTR